MRKLPVPPGTSGWRHGDHLADLGIQGQDGGLPIGVAGVAPFGRRHPADLLARAHGGQAQGLRERAAADRVLAGGKRRAAAAVVSRVALVLVVGGVRLVLIRLVGEIDDQVLEGRLDRLQAQTLEQDVAEGKCFHRRGVDAHAQLQLAELPGVIAQAAGQDLGEPIAERLLLREHALKPELLLGAGAQNRRDRVVGDLRGAAAVAHDQRGQEELGELRGGVRVEQPEAAQEGIHRDPERIRQPGDRAAVAALVPGPAGEPL